MGKAVWTHARCRLSHVQRRQNASQHQGGTGWQAALRHPAEYRQTTETIGYARVSSHDRKGQLKTQEERLWAYAGRNRIILDDVVSEVASGLNDNRKKLNALLSDPDVGYILVEHRERLARFGVNMIDAALKARGGGVLVIDDAEIEDDLVRDMTDVLTSFCARLYGKRSARNRAKRAMEAVR